MPASADSPNPERIIRLDGKIAVITGATGILGTHHSRTFAAAGATVLIADKVPELCDQLANRIKTEGGLAHSCPVDLSSAAELSNWAEKILRDFGPPDVLMNNAACKSKNFFAPLESFPVEDWNEVMNVNVTAIFLACKFLGTAMAKAGRGSIINVSSIYGILGPDQRIYDGASYPEMGGAINTPLVYSASKGAIISMTRYLATFWGHRGVRTNSLVPGGVGSGQNSTFTQRYEQRVPLSRMGTPADMAFAALFLASDGSAYINGQELIVDGGLSAW